MFGEGQQGRHMSHRRGVLQGRVAAAPAQVIDGQAQTRKALGDAGDIPERVGGQQRDRYAGRFGRGP